MAHGFLPAPCPDRRQLHVLVEPDWFYGIDDANRLARRQFNQPWPPRWMHAADGNPVKDGYAAMNSSGTLTGGDGCNWHCDMVPHHPGYLLGYAGEDSCGLRFKRLDDADGVRVELALAPIPWDEHPLGPVLGLSGTDASLVYACELQPCLLTDLLIDGPDGTIRASGELGPPGRTMTARELGPLPAAHLLPAFPATNDPCPYITRGLGPLIGPNWNRRYPTGCNLLCRTFRRRCSASPGNGFVGWSAVRLFRRTPLRDPASLYSVRHQTPLCGEVRVAHPMWATETADGFVIGARTGFHAFSDSGSTPVTCYSNFCTTDVVTAGPYYAGAFGPGGVQVTPDVVYRGVTPRGGHPCNTDTGTMDFDWSCPDVSGGPDSNVRFNLSGFYSGSCFDSTGAVTSTYSGDETAVVEF